MAERIRRDVDIVVNALLVLHHLLPDGIRFDLPTKTRKVGYNDNNNRYLSRISPSVAIEDCCQSRPGVQIELEFRSIRFCGGRKTGEP